MGMRNMCNFFTWWRLFYSK